jgi:hypothetical protein
MHILDDRIILLGEIDMNNLDSIRELVMDYDFYTHFIDNLNQEKAANQRNRSIKDRLAYYGVTELVLK